MSVFILAEQMLNFLIPNLLQTQGALQKNVSWYRKTFTLNRGQYEGKLVWLTFDGVYRACSVYINGALVTSHGEAYTSFIAYLHNASVPLKYGDEENVLAVYVDGIIFIYYHFHPLYPQFPLK